MEILPNAETIMNKETISWITSGLLAFYIFILVLSKRYVSMLGMVLFANQNKSITYQEFPYSFARTANLLVLFSIFIFSLFFYILGKYIHEARQIPVESVAFIAIAVSLYIIVKLIIIKIIGYISENDELKSKIFAVETIISSIYGLSAGFFLTLCFFKPYYDVTIWIIVASIIISLLFMFKISRIMMIFIEEKISLFFLILYLCAIEVLPVWFIIDFL